MIRLQTTIFSLLCILSIPWLLPASHLTSCLNVWLMLDLLALHTTQSITCTQQLKPLIQLNGLTCRLWKVCWGLGALCLWTPSHPGHPRFPWWHWSSSGSQTAMQTSVASYNQSTSEEDFFFFLLLLLWIRTMTKKKRASIWQRCNQHSSRRATWVPF